MKDFKELYEQSVEATFLCELHKILYDNELTNESLTTDHVEAFRNLFQRYINLRNLGDAVFHEFETGIKPAATTHIIEHVDLPDMFECCACGSDLKDFTRYCPNCGRFNIDFEEEKE